MKTLVKQKELVEHEVNVWERIPIHLDYTLSIKVYLNDKNTITRILYTLLP